VPIQIARVNDGAYLLCVNGFVLPQEQYHSAKPEDLARTVRFGLYESLFSAWDKEVAVVSSMGKQSTGKSYLLNHLFGTHFDVSGDRCTDGVWLSVQVVDEVMWVILDFEGLGSPERRPLDDVKLCVFNAAISDCTIFRIDHAVDRELLRTFERMAQAAESKVGSSKEDLLNQGNLLICPKDISRDSVAGVKRELKRKLGIKGRDGGEGLIISEAFEKLHQVCFGLFTLKI